MIIDSHTHFSTPGVMNINPSMEKMMEMQRIEKMLPGIDCAACGSPSCHAFAEDVVAGNAKEADCVFVMRNKLKNIVENFTE